jgi:ribosome recycling factor
LKQLSNISVEDSQTLAISPWEEKFIPEIEQAIMKANIGLNPVTTGNVIRIPLPPLTEERRIELTKQVKTEGEQAKISIRNIRRDSIQDLKDFFNEKMISEDDYHKGQTTIQNITDSMIENIDSLSDSKQKELMTI